MISCDKDEQNCLSLFNEKHFEQTLKFSNVLDNSKQVDVFVTSEPQFLINSIFETKIKSFIQREQKKRSDYLACSTVISVYNT